MTPQQIPHFHRVLANVSRNNLAKKDRGRISTPSVMGLTFTENLVNLRLDLLSSKHLAVTLRMCQTCCLTVSTGAYWSLGAPRGDNSEIHRFVQY
jgi:hypothetical protein